ncbi:hypothetical protein BC962_0215 [Gillisia mitskevichiae]|uniref:Uncharacterized protein n=1 Tax=Gillisia mitskevichiae TaxID=270921 RepID=A0A495PXX9_9FLAO|nr:hypothetical protein [Gillisia mitskevichiae]RKS55256.1 hypothetical protein BC962_0215 [Gillisia mitskevichiae]
MKFIFVLLFPILMAETCSQNNEQNKDISFTYETMTRGSRANYTLNKEEIKAVKNLGTETKASAKMTAKDWDNLIEKMKEIDVPNINQLKPPSDKRTFDGAAHAILTIKIGDKVYTSNSFDHGNPPSQLKSLVKAILRLGETVE